MLIRAQSDLDLELGSSILIGDKLSDLQAGCAAGVGTQILLSPERRELESQKISYHVSPSLDDIRSTFFSPGNRFAQTQEAEQLPKTPCRKQVTPSL